jgi:putative transcriptional regulator
MIVFLYSQKEWSGEMMGKKVKVKIKELAKKNGLSLRGLSLRADVRHPALSELSNDKRDSINFKHIEKIAESLNISDIREIIDLVDTED